MFQFGYMTELFIMHYNIELSSTLELYMVELYIIHYNIELSSTLELYTRELPLLANICPTQSSLICDQVLLSCSMSITPSDAGFPVQVCSSGTNSSSPH